MLLDSAGSPGKYRGIAPEFGQEKARSSENPKNGGVARASAAGTIRADWSRNSRHNQNREILKSLESIRGDAYEVWRYLCNEFWHERSGGDGYLNTPQAEQLGAVRVRVRVQQAWGQTSFITKGRDSKGSGFVAGRVLLAWVVFWA
ncbi:hypothetical protein PIB30_032615 [Stylosanthes scabra]|uniref:Uncharacterized protein n=1 Tax=Stylosanthes scabra TaxID=79078 RepID=A0ABU6UC17_9FABA|nr:hypothetical protein [Stylosanthes scabra]